MSDVESAIEDLRAADRSWDRAQAAYSCVVASVPTQDPERTWPHLYGPAVMNCRALWPTWRPHGYSTPEDWARDCVRAKLINDASFYWRLSGIEFGGNADASRPWIRELGSLRAQRTGGIVCTLRLGLMRHVALDLVLHGFSAASVATHSYALLLKSWYATVAEKLNRPGALRVVDVESAGGSREFVRTLRSGSWVSIAVEGSTGRSGPSSEGQRVEVDFLGRRLLLRDGVPRLAALTHVPLVPVLAPIDGVNTAEAQVGEPIIVNDGSPEECQRAMQALFTALEGGLRRNPGQWEGVTGLHRVLAPMASRPSSSTVALEVDLIGDSDGVRAATSSVTLVTKADAVFCVNGESMQVVKMPRELAPILSALFASRERVSVDEWPVRGVDRDQLQACLSRLVSKGWLVRSEPLDTSRAVASEKGAL